MRIVFTIEVEVERTSGKFLSREAIAEQIEENFYDPGTVSIDDSEYEITTWEVSRT